MAYSNNKRAVITGAGSGIGRALALQLNQEGCELLLSDIDEVGLAATLAQLERKDVAAHSQVLDISDKAAVHRWADDIDAQYGSIDILVNNAGVALVARAEEGCYEDIEWLMNINFWGVVYGTRAFLPLLRKSSQGHLVNISSIFGIIAVPTQSAYNAAKFAVRGYTEALRQELEGSNVHVCCVHPGGIKTAIALNSRTSAANSDPAERGAAFDQVARTTAASAASQIIRAVEKRKKRLLIGGDARVMAWLARLFPVSYPRFFGSLGQQLGET